MLSNHRVVAALSEAMPSPFRHSYDELIKVKDLFPEAKNQEKLILEDVDFFRLGPKLVRLDFSGCVFKKCSFDHLTIEDCIFDDAEIRKNNRFEDCFVARSNYGLSLLKESKSSDSHASILASFADYDSDGMNRKARCWQARCEKYPEDFLSYDKVFLGRKDPDFPMKSFGGFYYFIFPNIDVSQYQAGWKTHISINREMENMKKAFNLMVPYLAKRQYFFKFTIPDSEKSGRLFSNSQFTIYLTKGSAEYWTVEQVSQMMNDITKLFKENGIKPALSIPGSDAPTFSPYFSLRNDSVSFPASFSYPGDDEEDPSYLSGKQAGHHFNPCQSPNPYKVLLKSPSEKPFDLLEYFKAFEATGKDKDLGFAYNALRYTMAAYLREYTAIDTLEEKNVFVFRNQCARDLIIEDRFIKKDYQKDADIRKGIKIACSVLDYLCVKDKNFGLPQFSNYYPEGGDFLVALEQIEKLIASLPLSKNDHSPVYTFREHMGAMQKLEKDVEASSSIDSDKPRYFYKG